MERRTAHAAARALRRDLWLSAFWGAPAPAEVDEITSAWDTVVREDTHYRSLIDARRLERVDAASFGGLIRYLDQRRTRFQKLLIRQAILRPPGLVGAVVSGIVEVAGYPMPSRLFTDLGEAMAWLDADDLLNAAHTWLESQTALPEVVARLRGELARDLRAANLAQVARLLRVAPRSLQRRLGEAGTSFREELDRARVEEACRRLQLTDGKVSGIAHEVGFESESAFISLFRRYTGKSPGAWRSRG